MQLKIKIKPEPKELISKKTKYSDHDCIELLKAKKDLEKNNGIWVKPVDASLN
jgi:hypothetical protein